MGTVNSTENQALVSADLIEGEGLVDVNGDPVPAQDPKPIAALTHEGTLADGEEVPIVPGPIASAPEGMIPDDQAQEIADANTENIEELSKGALESKAKALGIDTADLGTKKALAKAITEQMKAGVMPGDVPEVGEGSGEEKG